jgi:transposase
VAHRGRRNADEQLAAALAGGATVRQAAKAAGVSEQTAHRRQDDPEFVKRVEELRADMTAAACGRLSKNMTKAADVLAELLDAKDLGLRYKAAAKLLELSLRVKDAVEMEQRVRELEADRSERERERRSGVGDL